MELISCNDFSMALNTSTDICSLLFDNPVYNVIKIKNLK